MHSTTEQKLIPLTPKDTAELEGLGTELTERNKMEKEDPEHHPWGNPNYGGYFAEITSAFRQETKDENFFVWFKKNVGRFREDKDIRDALENIRVLYFPEAIANQYLVTTNDSNQLVYEAQNNIVIDCSLPVSEKDHCFIYVMDLKGNLFIHKEGPIDPEKKDISVQHASFLRGENILCGGVIAVRNGKVTHIGNESGHYQPGAYSLSRVITELENRKVLAEDVKITVFSHANFNAEEEYSLKKFHETITIPPDCGLAKLNLSEKPNPLLINRAIDNYLAYKNKFNLRWLFSSNESLITAKLIKETKDIGKRYEITTNYIKQYPNRAFSKALQKELTFFNETSHKETKNFLKTYGITG